jgi:long-chain acyl-CoA synthetase
MVYGEGKPYLSAFVVLNDEEWARTASEAKLNPAVEGDGKDKEKEKEKDKAEKFLVQRIGRQIKEFPGYAQVRKVSVAREKWTIDNGLITPTLKLKRVAIVQKYAAVIDEMYKGHVL